MDQESEALAVVACRHLRRLDSRDRRGRAVGRGSGVAACARCAHRRPPRTREPGRGDHGIPRVLADEGLLRAHVRRRALPRERRRGLSARSSGRRRSRPSSTSASAPPRTPNWSSCNGRPARWRTTPIPTPIFPAVSQQRRFQELTETARVLDHPNAFVRPPYGETSPDTEAGHAQDRARPGLLDDRHLRLAAASGRRHRRAARSRCGRRASSSCTTDMRTRSGPSPHRVRAARRGHVPRLAGRTDKTVVSSYRDTRFNVIAVSPKNDSGVAIGS